MKNNLQSFFFVFLLLLLGNGLGAQQSAETPPLGATEKAPTGMVHLFYDCQSSWRCENYYDYVRNEIKMVEFVRDRFFGEVHLQIREQETSGGGSRFYLNYSGQQRFENMNDTLSFVVAQTDTDEERRQALVKNIQLGLIQYVARTDMAKHLTIKFEAPVAGGETKVDKDPYNYWVYGIGAGGNFSGDANYSDQNLWSDLRADRVTEKSKVNAYAYMNQNVSKFIFNEDTVTVKNNGYWQGIEVAKAMNQHWSYGINQGFTNSTFENIKTSIRLSPKIEYSLFPYKDFNSKRIVFSYYLGVQHNTYYDSTIFFKNKEWLARQTLSAIASFTQKWGNVNFGLEYANYLHDFKLNSLGMSGAIEWRIVKGLRFVVYGNYSFTHDQISIAKGDASRDDVLTRRRLIGSNFNYNTGIGVRYQFGSQRNSIVNPRFNGLNYSISL